MKRMFTLLLVCFALSATAQNMLKNSYFDSAWMFWDLNGCTPVAGADKATEPFFVPGVSPNYVVDGLFGGPSFSNSIARVDPGACLNQQLCIIKGLTYQISFKASRWTNHQDVPATVGMDVQILGLPSYTTYTLQNYTFNNTVFAYSTYTQNFTVPSGSTDNDFRLIMIGVVAGNLPYGPIVDSVKMTPLPTVAIAGPVAATVNAATNWSSTNLPGSGLTYSWSFPGATPSTSSSATPTNIQWATQGVKNVSCVVNNGTCDVFQIVQDINITAALPVDITSFTAKTVAAGVEVNWVTKTEINNDYFILQRSVNGVNFNDVAKISASGISTGSAYNYIDATAAQGKVYYRIKQVDKNGISKFTGIIKISTAVGDLQVNVYPSVIKNVLTYAVENKTALKLHVVIADYSGKVIKRSTENFGAGTTQKTVDATNLSAGVYLLSVTDGNNGYTKSIKFIKQ